MRGEQGEVAPIGADIYYRHFLPQEALSNQRFLWLICAGKVNFPHQCVAKVANEGEAAQLVWHVREKGRSGSRRQLIREPIPARWETAQKRCRRADPNRRVGDFVVNGSVSF